MERNYIWIKNGPALQKVAVDSIQYVSSESSGCELHTTHFSIPITCNLKQLLKALPDDLLTRVHRSYAVNTKHVTGISRTQIFVHRILLPVGRTYRKALLGMQFNSG
jgi:DNA-binding LytR/AlgR family response regulator